MISTGKLTVTYSCTLCGLQDSPLYVEYRDSETPITEWMTSLQHAVAHDHTARCPRCTSRVMRELKIPITGANWIGGPPIQ